MAFLPLSEVMVSGREVVIAKVSPPQLSPPEAGPLIHCKASPPLATPKHMMMENHVAMHGSPLTVCESILTTSPPDILMLSRSLNQASRGRTYLCMLEYPSSRTNYSPFL